MRTLAPTMIVLAIAVSGAMIGMSGFADAWGVQEPDTAGPQEHLDEQSSDMNPNNGPVSGPVSSGESDVVGLIADGLNSLVDLAAAVALLPVTLNNLGFPWWFAAPIGSLAYIITGIGLIEFASNRVWN